MPLGHGRDHRGSPWKNPEIALHPSGFRPIAAPGRLCDHRHVEVTRNKRTLFVRSSTDRVIAGVAGGIAARIGVDPTVVRLAFVVLCFAAGFGVVLYLFGWLVGSDPRDGDAEAASVRDTSLRQVVCLAMVVTGAMLLLRDAGLWFGDAPAISAGLAAFGSAILWTRADDSGRARFARLTSRLPRTPTEVVSGRSKLRLALGALLVLAGVATLVGTHTSFKSLGSVAFAVAVTVIGLGLALGPWIYQLFRQLGVERRERIRSEERAEVAAHLHDSVLQTLAMIQRASTTDEMTSLARGQERELRSWLYSPARDASGIGETVRSALEETAAQMEQLHRVPVETVVVGDAPMDDRMRALVDAAGEAIQNAGKHSGARAIAVYAEVTPGSAGVFVRDEGAGFDPANVPAERRGIAESIVARVERNGGSASIESSPAGTEVHVSMPRRPS